MKSVLISIKPKYCELIVSGQKTVEVRKTKPKIAQCLMKANAASGVRGKLTIIIAVWVKRTIKPSNY